MASYGVKIWNLIQKKGMDEAAEKRGAAVRQRIRSVC